MFVIIIDPSSLIKQKDKLTSDEKHIFLHELVKTIIRNTIVNGNKSFTSAVVVKMAFVDYKSGNNSMEYAVSTTGCNFDHILPMHQLEHKYCMSNHIIECCTILGIEAAQNFLFREFIKVLGDGVSPRH